MRIKPLRNDIKQFLTEHQLVKKFNKQSVLFENNFHHPSLNTELLEPKNLRIYSFRIDKKYRAIFIISGGEVEIVAINKHYQ